MSAPVFVVVGHPNKGKSSIVSTLAQDDRVEIAPDPGTTTHSRCFPMRVDGRVLYTLSIRRGFSDRATCCVGYSSMRPRLSIIPPSCSALSSSMQAPASMTLSVGCCNLLSLAAGFCMSLMARCRLGANTSQRWRFSAGLVAPVWL